MKTITKVTDTNVAVVEMVERKQVFSKKELDEKKERLLKEVTEVEELLAVLV